MRTMPFGKHRGAPLDEVPPKYLRWVLREVKTLALTCVPTSRRY